MLDKFHPITEGDVFSVTQWNTLADSLASDFPLCSNEYLQWSHRSELHLQHLKNRAMSDIICLEEVDHPELFETALSASHQILFHKKPDGKDGQLVAISHAKFEIIDNQPVQYQDSEGKNQNQSFFYLKLKCKKSSKQLLLFVTHLKAKKQFEHIRIAQIDFLLRFLGNIKASDASLENVPVIFAGDLNTEPTSVSVQNIYKTNIFASAYDYQHYKITTFKVREGNDVQARVIDYIFYTQQTLALISKNDLPTQEDIGKNGLPNEHFSSDHLSLSATFKFL